jgi:hypothetical protein
MINVKYFGSSDIPAFEKDFGSMEELIKDNPFRPFGKENKIGPTGKGFEFAKSSHRKLSNLEWQSSGHTGAAGKYAGFDEAGNPTVLDGGGGGVDGSVFGITIGSESVFIHGRRAVLHSPGEGWAGAVWDLSAGATLTFPAGATTYYFGLDPDDEAVCGITADPSEYPVSTKLYTVTDGVLTRVWNSGDINIIPMWLEGPTA